MVRLIKNGRRIHLLPPPSKADGEDDSCPDCKEKFNVDGKRRCCYAQCGHITCFECVRNSKKGCGQAQCSGGKQQVSSSSNVSSIPASNNLTGCLRPPVLTRLNLTDIKTSCPLVYGNGQREDFSGEPPPPVLDKEEEEDEIIDVENGDPDGDDQFQIDLGQRREASRRHKEDQSIEMSSSSRMGRWPCKHCNHRCTSKSALDEHLSKGHSNKDPVVAVKTPKQLVVPQLKNQTKGRPFQCYLCALSYNRMFHLVRHMEGKHKDQVHLLPHMSSKKIGGGGVRCPVCKLKFQTDRNKKYSLLRRAKTAKCDHICCLGCIAKMADGCNLCGGTAAGSKVNVRRDPLPPPQKVRKISGCFAGGKRGTTALMENNEGEGTTVKGTPQEDDFACQRCGFTYGRPYSLQRHVERGHKDIVKVSPDSVSSNEISHCPKCKAQFEMLKHSRFRRACYIQCEHSVCLSCLIEEGLRCSQCPAKGLTGEKQTVSSKSLSNGLKVKIIVGKKVGNGEMKIQENTQIEEGGRFHCLICNITFGRQLSFERHLGGMHGVELVKSEKKEDKGVKKGKHGDDLYCSECQEEFGPREKNMKAKYTTCGHTSCLKCILKAELGCGKCTTENDPRWIYVTAQGSPLQKRKMLTALEADADIHNDESQLSPVPAPWRKSVGKPSKSKNLKLPSKPLQKGRTARVPMTQNKKVYKMAKPIYGHGQSSKIFPVGMKPSRCNYCGKSFIGKVARDLHIQKFHSAHRHHVCNYCQWKSQSPRDLQRHILQHTKEKPFKCNLCTAAYTRKFTLVNHMDRMHLIS